MRWIDKLERRYGRCGIPYLLNIVLAGQLAVWFLVMFVERNLLYLLTLDRAALLHGQIWRLITFVFVPTLTTSPLMLLIELYFYWWVGNSLTRAWGDFRFTVYWLAGMLGAVVSCLLTGAAGTSGLFLSLFFAYAWMWPDQQVLLFFFIPIKIKWLGWAAAAMWLLEFITSRMTLRVSLLFGLAGFLVFFGPELFGWCKERVVSYKRRKDWENRWKQ